ncbi:MAG: hypothetical protein CO043_03540 [Parcubacteria group bacterium CG_4_9_14_0_2_um_filter_48_40]|nr:MAG: hypothetical protein CO043_03540 [Parcubacteria group bacterium CG_4_9_14_0_2_um_filter_48_40]
MRKLRKGEKQKKHRYWRINPFSRTETLLILGGAFVACAGAYVLLDSKMGKAQPEAESAVDARVAIVNDTAVATSTVRWYTGRLAAISIDNFSPTRPQWGLAGSLFVIEAPAEGGVTRFLAFYALDDAISTVDRIGPVRSARPYFVDWAQGYGALLAHVGGSPEALTQITKDGIASINEFYQGGYFWHDTRIPRPHNTFTDIPSLSDYGESISLASTTLVREDPAFAAYFDEIYGSDTSEYPQTSGYVIAQNAPYAADTLSTKFCDRNKMVTVAIQATGEKSGDCVPYEVREVVLDFSFPEYKVEWLYDASQSVYKRSQGGEKQYDAATGEPLIARTIVVQATDIATIDAIGRKRLRTEGEGDALILYHGRAAKMTWVREQAGQLRIRNVRGEEMSLPYDHLWLEVVSTLDQVTYE